MDIQEATIAMAKFMKIEKNFYDSHLKARRPKTIEEVEKIAELQKQFEVYKSRTRKFGNILAADPRFFQIMESWIVCVEGKDSVSRQSMIREQKTADVENLINSASNIASSVKSYIRYLGYYIHDMGAGEDGWDINMRCTEKDSKELCRLLHEKYFLAINHDLISISRKFGGHKLPGLYSYEDAEMILNIYGNKLPPE